ncbi:MAG: hypothetical protein HOK67_28670 [Deltaproteobacteria bacterium]|nr:hypothetical protein [Deltaproteobacteria bacterium]
MSSINGGHGWRTHRSITARESGICARKKLKIDEPLDCIPQTYTRLFLEDLFTGAVYMIYFLHV